MHHLAGSKSAAHQAAMREYSVRSGWTDDRVSTLKTMHADGQSASQIARALGGVSRNAVIAKIHRLGLIRDRKPSPPTVRLTSSVRRAPPKPKAPAKPRLVLCGNNTVVAHPERPPLVLIREDVWKPLPDSKPRPFESRRLCECNWPVEVEGAEPGTMRCCLAVEHGGYCSTHRAIARAPRQPRDAKPHQLARSLRRYA